MTRPGTPLESPLASGERPSGLTTHTAESSRPFPTPAVEAVGLGKRFARYHVHQPGTMKEVLLRGLRDLRPREHFWAVRDVSFSVWPGRILGIAGRNGAGKSTLLQLVGGVLKPDAGSIAVRGRISALLASGVGFQPELTGRENIFSSGVILGLTRREVAARFESIVAFAELEEEVDTPLRTYSGGMQMRLAFAVAVHTDPEVLLIDEVLAVGDIAFQRKCLERIAAFKEAGAAIVLVSHDADLIRRVCDDVLWLRDGQTAALGTADEVMARYVAEITEETHRRTPAHREPLRVSTGDTLRVNENRFGSFELEITDVRLLDPSGSPAAELDSGDPLTVEITYRANEPVPSPIFGVRLVREDGAVCCDLSTRSELDMRTVTGSGRLRLNVRRLDLGRGSYFVDVGAYERNWSHAYDYHWHAYSFDIRSSEPGDGLLRPPHAWTLDATSVDANATAEAAADPSTSRPR